MPDTLNTFVFQNAAVATGAGNPIPGNDLSGIMIQITGITSATVTFKGSVTDLTDSSSFYAVQATNMTTGLKSSTATADGLYYVPNTAGFTAFECPITTYVSGTITVTGRYVTTPVGDVSSGSVTSALQVGQAKIAVTSTAVQLSSTSQSLQNGLVVTAKTTDNAAGIFVGGSSVNTTYDGTGNGTFVAPGNSKSIPSGVNLNTLYFNGTAGDIVDFIGN